MYEQLALLSTNLSLRTYPNYPARRDRLVADPFDIQTTHEGKLILPDGPWTIDNHPNQPFPESAPDETTQKSLLEKGLTLDAAGRPLHPWFRTMLTNPSIGVVLGKGAYWNWGPNYTADPIVIQNDHILLVRREDTGLWSLPGGHVDPGETASEAAPREVAEETGIHIPNGVEGTVVYEGPVVDLRVTANAWPETTAIVYRLPAAENLPTPTPQPGETTAAEWVPLNVVEAEGTLFGSHRFLLKQALK